MRRAKIKANDKYITESSNKTWKAVQDRTGKKTTHKNVAISQDGKKSLISGHYIQFKFLLPYEAVADKLVKKNRKPTKCNSERNYTELNNLSVFLV